MPTFRFRYETLLEHRRRLEDAAQRELAQHLRTRMILHDQLRRQQQTIQESKQQLGQSLVGRVDVAAVGRFAQYSGQARLTGQQIVQRLAALERTVAEARERLLDASRQRKALEVLRDKHLRQWQREQELLEQNEIDDLTTQRYARQMQRGATGAATARSAIL